jgi:hypothetical protein
MKTLKHNYYIKSIVVGFDVLIAISTRFACLGAVQPLRAALVRVI